MNNLYKNNKKNNIKYQNKIITTYDFFVNMQFLLLKRNNYFLKCNIKDSIKNIMLINNHTPSMIIKLLEKKPYYDELTEILYWYDNKVYDNNVKKLDLKNNNLDYIYKTIFNNKNISFYKIEEIYNCFSNPNIGSIVIMFISHSLLCKNIWDNFVSTLNNFDNFGKSDKFDNIVIKYDKIINYNSFDNYIKDIMRVADINYTKKNRYIIYGKVYDYHKKLCVEQFTEYESFSYYMKYTDFILFSESDNYYIRFISEYGKLSIYFVQNINKLNPIKCHYSNIDNIIPLIFVPKNISESLLRASRKLTHKNLIIAYENERNKRNELLYLGS